MPGRAPTIAIVVALVASAAPAAVAQTVVEPEPDRGGTAQRPEPRPPADRAPDPSAPSRDERLARDPFSTMGGKSPLCTRPLDPPQRESCRRSGALEHPHRIDHYGFDIHVDTGPDNIPGNFFHAIQTLALLAWLGVLYLLKGCLLAQEWAFSLDLLSDTMSAVRQALGRLHSAVLGEPWLLAAVIFAGIWAMWRGLVQRRPAQALGGLLGTVALMVVALVLIARPAETVGRASALANQAALGMVAGASTGTLNRPEAGFGRATSRLFDQLVLRPWCALEFADIEFCLADPRRVIAEGDLPDDAEIRRAWATAPTVADLWLRFEPNGDGDGNDQRNRIYEHWRDNDGDRLQAVVRIQKQGGTAARIALLLLIAVGLVAAIAFLAWLVFRLLGFGVLALLLVLLTPLMLLAPALGDAGRATFVAWAKRLVACLLAKAIYALFLAVVLVASAALAEAYELGWIAAWVLQIVFWWALLLKRNDLLAFVTAPLPEAAARDARGGVMHSLRNVVHMQALASAGAGAAATAAAPATRGAGAVLGLARDRRDSASAATRQVSEAALRRQGREQIQHRHAAAAGVLAQDREATTAARHVDSALRRYDERAALAHARGEQPPEPTEAETALLGRRAEIERERPVATEVATAREQLRHADVNRARSGEPVTAADEQAWIATRRADLQQELPVDHDRNLRAAGVDPDEYRAASEADQTRLRGHVETILAQERARLRLAAPEQPDERVPRTELKAARATLDDAELREARQREYSARRQERRAQRTRRHPRPHQARRW